METLKNYVNWKLAHSDKVANAEGYPLVMENCKANKRIKQLEVYGDCFQSQTPSPDNPSEIQSVGDLITDTGSEYYGKYKIPITVSGKNLIPYPYIFTTITINGVTFTDNGDGSITVNGTATANAVFYLVGSQDNYTLDKCGLKIGDSYTISKILISGDSIANVYFTANYYNTSDSMKSGAVAYSANTATSTIQSDFKSWGIYLLVAKDKTVNNTTIKFQIEKGTSATDYEPYVEPVTQNIYLDEPLRGALYQSREKQWYYDVIDYNTNKIIRNIAERTFTGATNEKWTMAKETDNKIHFYIPGIPNNCSFGTSDDNSIICNLFNGSYMDATQNSDKEGISLAFTTNMCYIAIFKNRLTDIGLTLDLDGFKTWLSQNPITVTYISKTPTEEDISCKLPKTLAKTTVISAGTSLEPSNIKGKYIIK